ncbi:MAG TPA: YgiT-type zinc finger protein [Ktedonobacterales bacterium]|nr:YgiT-type zinc finger protein [Ktedonobacterales bacterium]
MTSDTKQRKFVPALEAPHQPTPEVCPNCELKGTMHREIRDELIDVGDNVFIVPVQVDTCDHCGEHVYDMRTVAELEALEARLRSGDFAGFAAVGTVYRPS